MREKFIVPTFTEIDMSAEIGSYQEDFEPPAEPDFATPQAPRDPRAVHAKRALQSPPPSGRRGETQ